MNPVIHIFHALLRAGKQRRDLSKTNIVNITEERRNTIINKEETGPTFPRTIIQYNVLILDSLYYVL